MTRPQILAYYFPNWHRDSRNCVWFGDGWTEWDLLRAAQPRFDGHRQPREPALGYRDEADPVEAAIDIDLASAHGVDGFLVDFYWYEDGAYLSRALDDGLLQATNIGDIKFALMWANHDLVDIFPSERPGANHRTLRTGALTREEFERFGHAVVEKYFTHASYLTVDGAPWLSIYQIGSLVEGLGGIDETVDALDWLRALARKHGFPGVHLDAVVWGFGVLPRAVTLESPEQLLSALRFQSASSYIWIHHDDLRTHPFPIGDTNRLRSAAFDEYERYASTLSLPFYPNVTVGWDPSPRTEQAVQHVHDEYPWNPIFDATPEEFVDGLEAARDFLVRHDPPSPIVTVNAWNEWTEGSALLPDTTHGHSYLEAIRSVFGLRGGVKRPDR
ncbi:hypothetical protein QFZ53_000413 [Microbacterium natoriense]|uniref:Glycosyl transferase family WbsX n=1 Tax=Microbacterium natoriense TaxID=284570 RepID=A0AAW8EV03_9MICO|nr:glycoside hydrolase family 99-like domain-containing protein [Microbacterium natoriense]MDQ0646217.1 hypothetical protein [Microbacterium natoriense]